MAFNLTKYTQMMTQPLPSQPMAADPLGTNPMMEDTQGNLEQTGEYTEEQKQQRINSGDFETFPFVDEGDLTDYMNKAGEEVVQQHLLASARGVDNANSLGSFIQGFYLEEPENRLRYAASNIWPMLDNSVKRVRPENGVDDYMGDQETMETPVKSTEEVKVVMPTVAESNNKIQKLAQQHSKQAKKSEGFNLTKYAQHKTVEELVLHGPDSKRISPFTGQLESDWHVIERNKGWGYRVGDLWNLDFEQFWRQNIMDKYSRPYKDKDGNLVGGYIQKRFEVDKWIPEENNYQLKPGQWRKPYLPEQRSTEARLEAMRAKKDRGYEPDSQGDPYDWNKKPEYADIKIAQGNRTMLWWKLNDHPRLKNLNASQLEEMRKVMGRFSQQELNDPALFDQTIDKACDIMGIDTNYLASQKKTNIKTAAMDEDEYYEWARDNASRRGRGNMGSRLFDPNKQRILDDENHSARMGYEKERLAKENKLNQASNIALKDYMKTPGANYSDFSAKWRMNIDGIQDKYLAQLEGGPVEAKCFNMKQYKEAQGFAEQHNPDIHLQEQQEMAAFDATGAENNMDLEPVGKGQWKYEGEFHISYNPKPIPDRSHDYDWGWDNYDGAPDAGAPDSAGAGTAASLDAAIAEIEEFKAEHLSPSMAEMTDMNTLDMFPDTDARMAGFNVKQYKEAQLSDNLAPVQVDAWRQERINKLAEMQKRTPEEMLKIVIDRGFDFFAEHDPSFGAIMASSSQKKK